MRVVAIYRDRLLPFSETFIKAQAESLQEFSAVYAGCRRVPGLHLNGNPVVNFKDSAAGRAEEIVFKSLGWAPRMSAALGCHDPSLLHAHFGPDGAVALPLARSLNIPLLVTFHGFDANLTDQSFRENRWGRRYLRQRNGLKRHAGRFIAVSSFIAKKMLEQGFPAEKLSVHYIGVNTKTFQAGSEGQRKKSVLFVGRLVEKKGCEYLIRAMELVQAEMPDVELVVIGDGPLFRDLQALAKKALRKFQFLGAQPESVVQDWMKRAMILSIPSVVAASGDAEGLPIALLEAQSSGMALTGFASAGIPEAVVHGETGLLAPEKDWRSLAGNIARLVKDKKLASDLIFAGRKRMHEMFDLQKQTAKLEAIYTQVIVEHARGARC